LAARTRHTDDIGGRPEILMIAPSVEDHLLGIFVATEILEAHGCFVHVALDHSDRELAALVRSKRFSMIGLTVSSRKTVFEAGRIIKALRKVSTSSTPIVIGGGEATYDSKDIAAATGADFVVSNPLEALKLCKIDCDANAKLRIA
jgi:methylmalonyl-CoA mutase cobalamin-binding subunit